MWRPIVKIIWYVYPEKHNITSTSPKVTEVCTLSIFNIGAKYEWNPQVIVIDISLITRSVDYTMYTIYGLKLNTILPWKTHKNTYCCYS